MKLRVLILTFSVLVLSLNNSLAQSPLGTWKTIDDNTKEAKSHVEIYEQNGQLYGKIVKILTDNADRLCDKCSGEKKNKPIMGMIIIENLKKTKDYWAKGTIMDPENGKEYGCSIWFEDGKTGELKVRGKHWTGLYRTQTWYKVR